MDKSKVIYDIGQRIKRRREELGMSQQELANRVGYKSRSSINKIELGINDVGQTALQKIAAALGTTSGVLLGEASLAELVAVENGYAELADFFEGQRVQVDPADVELGEYLEMLRNRSECRMLFSLAKEATKEDVEKAVAIIEALRKAEGK